MTAQAVAVDPVLTFRIGPRFLGIPISRVGEILPAPRATPVPLSFGHVDGIMEYRNRLITVFNVGRRFSVLPSESAIPHMIVVQDGPATYGLLVDGIGKIVTQPNPADVPPNQPVLGLPRTIIRSVIDDAGLLVPVIDPGALFGEKSPIRLET